VKLIFLDIDGVINSQQSMRMMHRFGRSKFLKDFANDEETLYYLSMICPVAISNLMHLVKYVPEVRFVISSTWRKHSLGHLRKCFEWYGLSWDLVIGATPVIYRTPEGVPQYRGDEIQAWLNANKHLEIEDFVILDDDSDMAHLKEKHLIKTDNIHGLLLKQAESIIERFTGKDSGDVYREWHKANNA